MGSLALRLAVAALAVAPSVGLAQEPVAEPAPEREAPPPLELPPPPPPPGYSTVPLGQDAPPYVGPPPAAPVATPPAAVTAEPEAPESARPGDPTRVIYAPTAFQRAQGTGALNFFELGTFSFDYGVHDNVTIGAQTTIPIGFVALGGTAKLGVDLDGFSVGAYANAIFALPFEGTEMATIVVAGPVLTVGGHDTYFNGGGFFLSIGVEGEGSVGFFVPHLGFSHRVSRSIRVGAELYMLASPDDEPAPFEAFAILWGMRFFGDWFWGDVALINPICQDCSDLYSVLPIGIPFLNFGVQI